MMPLLLFATARAGVLAGFRVALRIVTALLAFARFSVNRLRVSLSLRIRSPGIPFYIAARSIRHSHLYPLNR
jgi:hypothetical protein